MFHCTYEGTFNYYPPLDIDVISHFDYNTIDNKNPSSEIVIVSIVMGPCNMVCYFLHVALLQKVGLFL
jgi:hypothetical protein